MNQICEEIRKVICEHPNFQKALEIAEVSKYVDDVEGLEEMRGKKIAELLGIDCVSFGGSRVVLGYKDYVVKFPLEPRGFLENSTEVEFYEELPEDMKRFFSRCFGGDENFAVFEKAIPMEYEELSRYENDMRAILETLSGNGVEVEDCEEDRYDQWGLADGKLVILDYGASF